MNDGHAVSRGGERKPGSPPLSHRGVRPKWTHLMAPVSAKAPPSERETTRYSAITGAV